MFFMIGKLQGLDELNPPVWRYTEKDLNLKSSNADVEI